MKHDLIGKKIGKYVVKHENTSYRLDGNILATKFSHPLTGSLTYGILFNIPRVLGSVPNGESWYLSMGDWTSKIGNQELGKDIVYNKFIKYLGKEVFCTSSIIHYGKPPIWKVRIILDKEDYDKKFKFNYKFKLDDDSVVKLKVEQTDSLNKCFKELIISKI